jgi:hypothetical protein
MTRRIAWLCLTPILCLAGAAAAAVDGSKPLLCVVTEAVECPHDASCHEVTFEDMNIPAFIRVDANAKKLSEHKGARTTAAQSVVRKDGHIFLQGVEERAWSLSISEATGKMALTAAGSEVGFVVSGVCTEL